MRIVSLLPSATEIVYALGLDEHLVGVTHECDWPPEARTKPAVSISSLPPGASPSEIDGLVSASIGGGEPIYRLDEQAIRELRPDVVLTQDLCAVCAVPSGHVNEALQALGCRAEVVSLDPSSLDDVVTCLLQVGRVTGVEERAEQLVVDLRRRLQTVHEAVARLPRPRTFALEWSDPPFNGGHWVPDMILAAGGEPVLASARSPSIRVGWPDICASAPEVLLFIPCGYDLDQACAEAVSLLDRPELQALDRFLAADASSYFSRPGPRVVDGVEALAAALHPQTALPGVAPVIRRLR